MRFLIALLAIFSLLEAGLAWRSFHRGRKVGGNVGTPILSKDQPLPEEMWFNQTLDHFNPVDGHTWEQRYFMRKDFWKKNGPVFLMIGGEGPAAAKWMVEGQWLEYAKQFGALCFQLEHRFYGKSHPTSDLSVKNLQFLSSEQALADIAYFIEGMRDLYQIPRDAKWIMFGGSYSGSLAAWMREKYPHLVHGAMSASGPLLAEIDFQQYYVVVEESLKTYSQACVDAVQEAMKQVHIMLRHRIGQQGLGQKFNLCDPIDPGHTTKNDISNLYETLASNFADIVQYNKDNRNGTHYSIEDVCKKMTNATQGIAVDRLAEVSNMLLKVNKEKCLDYKYSKMIEEMRNVSWSNEVEGGRQWMYQTCTEFGFFQTSTAKPLLFSDTFPVQFFIQQCSDVFGPRFLHVIEPAVNRTNIVYGGYDLKVTNVVFVHGSIDPWHALGITKSNNPAAPAIYIDGTAHCANIYPPSANDLPQLVSARKQVGKLISQWLAS